MSFDRSKYKAKPMSSIKDVEKEAQKKRPTKRNEGYVNIEDGDNIIRIFPPHPDGGGSAYMVPFGYTWQQIKKQKYQNGEPVEGEFEIKPKKVFNAKVHGNYPEDLVDAYFSYVYANCVSPIQDKEENKKAWNKLAGRGGIKNQGS